MSEWPVCVGILISRFSAFQSLCLWGLRGINGDGRLRWLAGWWSICSSPARVPCTRFKRPSSLQLDLELLVWVWRDCIISPSRLHLILTFLSIIRCQNVGLVPETISIITPPVCRKVSGSGAASIDELVHCVAFWMAAYHLVAGTRGASVTLAELALNINSAQMCDATLEGCAACQAASPSTTSTTVCGGFRRHKKGVMPLVITSKGLGERALVKCQRALIC